MKKRLAELGKFLRSWRTIRGLKLKSVASEIGISTSTLGHWETGMREPTMENLEVIAIYLKLPLPCLVCMKLGDCNTEGSRRRCEGMVDALT